MQTQMLRSRTPASVLALRFSTGVLGYAAQNPHIPTPPGAHRHPKTFMIMMPPGAVRNPGPLEAAP